MAEIDRYKIGSDSEIALPESSREAVERFNRLAQLVTDLDRTLTELPLPGRKLYDEIEQSVLNARRAVNSVEGRLCVAMMQERNELRKAAHECEGTTKRLKNVARRAQSETRRERGRAEKAEAEAERLQKEIESP